MELYAQWIWLANKNRRPRNQTIIARKTVYLPVVTSATMVITADTQYRLYINGQWIEDGPCRSWPQHYQYDQFDVTPYLQQGRNVIVVIARHFGSSTFHQIPQEAGLLAQLDVVTHYGETLHFGTDATWLAQEHPCCQRHTARVSIQMEQAEWYDATRGLDGVLAEHYDDRSWPHALSFYPAHGGPWQDLHPRDVGFLSRESVHPIRLVSASVVHGAEETITFDLKRLCYPTDLSANLVPMHGVLATIITSAQAQIVPVHLYQPAGITLHCRGEIVTNGELSLEAGDNLLTIVIDHTGHLYDFSLAFQRWDGIRLRNPCGNDAATPWAWTGPFAPLEVVTNQGSAYSQPTTAEVSARLLKLGSAVTGTEFYTMAGARTVPESHLLKDSYLAFRTRQVIRPAEALLKDRTALLADNQQWTTIEATPDGDIELCFDLGKETVGWVEFELIAPAFTVVDGQLIEYQTAEQLQYTDGNRNGFRYICKHDVNHFISFKRRAGRYLYLTLRQMIGPVKFRLVRMIQATYPVEHRGAFRCSDPLLDRMWEISAHTLQLCMEDTYTDCPLYEQTLWVGDARNESLYNTICFGADELTLRCLRLSAQSLETLPIVGSQVPSGWDILLPAWSFLWVINVWEYFFSTGDLDGLASLYPAVVKNLRNALHSCQDHGLFSLEAWNLFDWAGIDQDQRTVLHNSLFLIGALDAALRCCQALGAEDANWLQAARQQLRNAVLAQWDAGKGSYPDALRDDGTISPSSCQHTGALALLYDVLPPGAEAIAHRHLLEPPAGMVQIGSPFALQYLLEALEKVGDDAHAVALVREKWQDMLACGATTCWETFRGHEAEYPTRSHCHAWSSAPIYVFNRTLLGIRPTAPGVREVVVSPHPLGLTWAEGTSASPRGDLHVAWRCEHGTLSVQVSMPEGVQWRVEPNADWGAIERVIVNGEEHPELVHVGLQIV